ncbi:MAG: ATPase, T2SS/T4P/T4SS family [Actinomycetes bacterium]
MSTATTVPAADSAAGRRRRLGEVLVAAGLITHGQLGQALAVQATNPGQRRRLGQVLTDLEMVTEEQVSRALAEALGLDLVDLAGAPPDPETVRRIPRAVADRTRSVLLGIDGPIATVAAADPTNVLALDDVRAYARAKSLVVLVATDTQVRHVLERSWAAMPDDDEVSDVVAEMVADDPDEGLDIAAALVEDAPTVRLVDRILGDAVRLGASDVHLEPQTRGLVVRYRVDGILREAMVTPRSTAAAVISRIKIMSGIDIAERRVPQDGRARLSVDESLADVRVSTLPTLHGEKVVIRLLTQADRVPSLDELGFDAEQLATMRDLLRRPQGLILLTGPTGSGKTNTLYACIKEILSPELNIVTLEDPVEIALPGITQVQVNERTGMTFGRGLRAVLRQDPDVVLVGEVRDTETAQLALRAALTGHLVLTTLHTNGAVQALTRLVDMGAAPYLVASSLSATVAQRLVRRPCLRCAEPYDPDEAILGLLGLRPGWMVGAHPVRGRGCTECGHTGYRGRTGVFEVVPVTAGIRHAMVTDPTEDSLTAIVRVTGGTGLRQAAVAAAAAGTTTYEEAVRVTDDEAPVGPRCPVCGQGVQLDWRHCPRCGEPVVGEPVVGEPARGLDAPDEPGSTSHDEPGGRESTPLAEMAVAAERRRRPHGRRRADAEATPRPPATDVASARDPDTTALRRSGPARAGRRPGP